MRRLWKDVVGGIIRVEYREIFELKFFFFFISPFSFFFLIVSIMKENIAKSYYYANVIVFHNIYIYKYRKITFCVAIVFNFKMAHFDK